MQLHANQVIYKFSKNNPPALKVPAGTTITVDTMDCFSNQLRQEEDRMETLDWDRINPATGPIYVEGAEPGDVLKVTIHNIELDEKGTVVAGEDFGVLGGLLKESHTRIVTIREGVAHFLNGIQIPINPMIGVIGVAPAEEEVNTGTPGNHGGNMDNTMITTGATLYFNVEVPGALFAMGDAHAAMGDGEIGVSGLEIPARVSLTLDVVKGKTVRFPTLENKNAWSVIASAETLDEAVQLVTEGMFRFLSERMTLEPAEITMLMSLAGQLQFCQVVDPLKTIRFVIPKQYTGELTI